MKAECVVGPASKLGIVKTAAGASNGQSSTPPTLTSLPIELQARIIHYLDNKSLLSINTVSRSLHHLAEIQIWRHFNLTFDRDHGDLSAGTRTELQNLAAKTSGVRTRWESVRSVKGVCTTAKAGLLFDVLTQAAHSLQALHLDGCPIPQPLWYRMRGGRRMFDRILSESTLSFPSLTHVTIGPSAFCRYDFLELICSRSPNLIHLDFSLDQCVPSSRADKEAKLPSFTTFTHLRTLRVVSTSPEVDGITTARRLIRASPELRCLIIRFWPDEPESYCDDHNLAAFEQKSLLGALRGHKHLEDLYWPVDRPFSDHSSRRIMKPLRSLVRIVVRCQWLDTNEWVCELPNLEQLFLDCSKSTGAEHTEISHNPSYTFPSRLLLNFCDFADTLRRFPRLHILHTLPTGVNSDDFVLFDQLEAYAATPMGRVGSLKHGASELVCARLLVYVEAVADREWSLPEDAGHGERLGDAGAGAVEAKEGKQDRAEEIVAAPQSSDGDAQAAGSTDVPMIPPSIPRKKEMITSGTTVGLRYTARDGSMRERVYDRRSEPSWVVLCDYEGLPVPLEVVQAMREADGLVDEAWERRGVCVGAAAWSILTGWYEECLAEEVADRETGIVQAGPQSV